MATNTPIGEDVELSEEQRLLEGEETSSRHVTIVKDKEPKVKSQVQKGEKDKKSQEQKGEKDKKKRRSERGDEDRIDRVQMDDGNNQDGGHDDHQGGGHDNTVRDIPLCCVNSSQNTERINNILRNTKRYKTTELTIKIIASFCLLAAVSIVSFNYGREAKGNESRMDMKLKIPTGHESSNLMKKIGEVTLKSLHTDGEREEVTERQEDVTESEPDTKKYQEYQGQGNESDDIFFVSEARDRKSTTSTTKKPRGVSFWPK